MLSSELNRRILKLAPAFEAKDVAPYSLATLNACTGLVVWSGASDKTIYGDPRVNWAFRAWHDALHLKLNAEFTFEGEKRVAIEQARLIGSDRMGLIVMGEVVGQVEYLEKHGHFPVDQLAFIRQYIKAL